MKHLEKHTRLSYFKGTVHEVVTNGALVKPNDALEPLHELKTIKWREINCKQRVKGNEGRVCLALN